MTRGGENRKEEILPEVEIFINTTQNYHGILKIEKKIKEN